MRLLPTAVLVLALAAPWPAQHPPAPAAGRSPVAQSCARKLEHIRQNGMRPHPDPAPTVLSENEINAFIASGGVRLPKGVRSAYFQGRPGIITGTSRVDFDELTEGRRSSNPLLGLFTGVHDVVVVAHAQGVEGQAMVQVDSVAIDNVEVPRLALEFFIARFLRPKYPAAGMETRFAMPSRINRAVVGEHALTVVQK